MTYKQLSKLNIDPSPLKGLFELVIFHEAPTIRRCYAIKMGRYILGFEANEQIRLRCLKPDIFV
jgi:hypothetical protein